MGSDTLRALFVKLVGTFVAVWAGCGLVDANPVGACLGLAAGITAANYLVGDLLILPAAGNIVATLADGGLAAGLTFLAGLFMTGITVSLTGIIVVGILVALFEYFFHQFLLRAKKVAP